MHRIGGRRGEQRTARVDHGPMHQHTPETLLLGCWACGLWACRMRRFSAVIVNNEIKAWNLEGGGELTCSLSNPTLEQLKALA